MIDQKPDRPTPHRPDSPEGKSERHRGAVDADPAATGPAQPEGERGGPKGPEPTRFGDWEKNGRCFDF